jgi:transposase
MTSEYARAEGGNRAKMPKPGCHWDHFSIIGAISIFGIVALAYGRWATNALTFLSFIKEFLLKKLRKGHVIFMDNVQFHKNTEVKKLIESTGAKLVFLPPYSPDFSPIEKMWSKIKHYLKKLKSWSSAEFHTALSSALMELNDEDFEEWYDCCGYAMVNLRKPL